ncbi:fatty acid-binding protein, liver-type-like [Perca flavescens]|uniref:fatty acid-binding protein, liver-type-like n=1 Tax=Perca flavescens TaxID=8167 RepID=UPI00106EAE7A|nr:fatty acid-binding protein, liver-type-like [Perca flavescens]
MTAVLEFESIKQAAKHFSLLPSLSAIMSSPCLVQYQLKSQENFECFMKAIGLLDELIQKGKDIKSISEIEETGDNFKVLVYTFTIGQEAELETATGEKAKAVIQGDGNKLKGSLKGIKSVTELVDLNTTVNVGDKTVSEWGRAEEQMKLGLIVGGLTSPR